MQLSCFVGFLIQHNAVEGKSRLNAIFQVLPRCLRKTTLRPKRVKLKKCGQYMEGEEMVEGKITAISPEIHFGHPQKEVKS